MLAAAAIALDAILTVVLGIESGRIETIQHIDKRHIAGVFTLHERHTSVHAHKQDAGKENCQYVSNLFHFGCKCKEIKSNVKHN